MQILLYAIALTVVTILSTPIITCAQEKKPAQEEKSIKARGLPFRGKISAVDAQSQTVSLAGKKTRTFKITPTTKIKREGKPVSLDQVEIGESVGGYALNYGSGLPEVVTLNIRKPQPKKGQKEDKS